MSHHASSFSTSRCYLQRSLGSDLPIIFNIECVNFSVVPHFRHLLADADSVNLLSLPHGEDAAQRIFIAGSSLDCLDVFRSQFEAAGKPFEPVRIRGHELVQSASRCQQLSNGELRVAGLCVDHGRDGRTTLIGNEDWQWACLNYFSQAVALDTAIGTLFLFCA